MRSSVLACGPGSDPRQAPEHLLGHVIRARDGTVNRHCRKQALGGGGGAAGEGGKAAAPGASQRDWIRVWLASMGNQGRDLPGHGLGRRVLGLGD